MSEMCDYIAIQRASRLYSQNHKITCQHITQYNYYHTHFRMHSTMFNKLKQYNTCSQC